MSGSGYQRLPLVSSARRSAGRLKQRLALRHSGADNSVLRPLLLTANGRSGTTYLMQLLNAQPAISLYNHYPFEHNQAAYFVNLYRTLTGSPDADLVQQSYAHLVAQHEGWLSRNPFLSATNEATLWYEKHYQPATADFVRHMCSDYYRHLAKMAGKNEPLYFSECVIPSLPLADDFYRLWPDTREILLVRDMRDLLCSVLAFNRKRGHHSFGREIVDTDEQYVDHVLSAAAEDVLRAWRNRGENMHLVRYEDLVSDTATVLGQLFGYLDIDDSGTTIDASLQAQSTASGHKTTADASSSIGRWKTDLDEDMLARCNDVFAQYLDTFGYHGS